MSGLTKKVISLLLVIVTFFQLTGCARTKLLGGIDEKGEKIFLTPADSIPDSIDRFIKSQDISNEDCRINYLLYRIEQSNLTFIRNRVAYSSADAANFLRWKLNRPRWRPLVKTAREFIIIITSGSVMSHQPYQIVFPNKKPRHELKPILINELDFLEEYLKLKAEAEDKKSAVTTLQETIQKVTDSISEKTSEKQIEPAQEAPPEEITPPAAPAQIEKTVSETESVPPT